MAREDSTPMMKHKHAAVVEEPMAIEEYARQPFNVGFSYVRLI